MKLGWAVAVGIVGGLLGAGVMLLVSSPPRGTAVLLRPPPTPAPILVHVTGAVLHPDVYEFAPGSRIKDAIEAAGGAAAAADLSSLNLAAPLSDGGQVVVSEISRAAESGDGSQRTRSVAPEGLVDINRASREELDSLPDIGLATAEKIITYREEHGPFPSIEAIQDVPGIGTATFEKIRESIIAGAAP